MYFERVASTWMWRRKCGAERESEWGKEEQKGRASKKARKHLRCPQIRIRFRILDFVASSLTKLPDPSDNNGITAGTPLATVA